MIPANSSAESTKADEIVSTTTKTTSGSDSQSGSDGNNGSSFFLLLLLVAAVMGGYGVWRLGGIERTKSHLLDFVENVKARIVGGGRRSGANVGYSQINGDLPR